MFPFLTAKCGGIWPSSDITFNYNQKFNQLNDTKLDKGLNDKKYVNSCEIKALVIAYIICI